ncbi:unnamed protein product [Orchesella dallaii]|uniref:Protein TEX261 n=1 Tax=Orchesella dallaii TaxID=48710 RepID=A0ABP1QJL6_9HEXA
MWFLLGLSYVVVVFQFCFVSMAFISGLYYLADLVEEFVSVAAKVIRTIIKITIGIYVGILLFEEFPLLMTACGLFSQILHWYMMKTFPYFVLCSPTFILMVTFSVLNHYLAFTYFSSHHYQSMEIMAYVVLCLWLVPFVFLVSLTANDLVLPTTSHINGPKFSQVDNDAFINFSKRKGNRMGLLSHITTVQEVFLPKRPKEGRKFPNVNV